MAYYELSEEERYILEEVLSLRMKAFSTDDDFDKSAIAESEKIMEKLRLTFFKPTPYERAVLHGCLEEFIIEPNEKLRGLDDFTLLKSYDQSPELFERIDLAITLQNKFKPKGKKPRSLIETRINELNLLLATQVIHYSAQPNGNIYKAGIMMSSNKGVRLDLSQQKPIERFQVEGLSGNIYEVKSTPPKVLEKISEYSKQYSLSKRQESFKQFLELALA